MNKSIVGSPTRPQQVIDAVNNHSGDYLVLGVGGKMGTTLALMLEEAIRRSGRDATVTGVSRFSRPEVRAALEAEGVKTLACDLASPEDVAKLPTPTNVFFLAGQKFGTTDAPEATWLQNTIVPGIVARHFTTSRMVVFSTGCVYPFAAIGRARLQRIDSPRLPRRIRQFLFGSRTRVHPLRQAQPNARQSVPP